MLLRILKLPASGGDRQLPVDSAHAIGMANIWHRKATQPETI
jgi:hypothetical protein